MSELISTKKRAAKRGKEAFTSRGLLGVTCKCDCTCGGGESGDSSDTGASDDSTGDSTDEGGGEDRPPIPYCSCPPTVIESTYPRITIAEQGQIARIPGIAVRLSTCEGQLGTLEAAIEAAHNECEAEHETMKEGIAANAKAVSEEKTRAEDAERVLTDKVNGKVSTETFIELETKVNGKVDSVTYAELATKVGVMESELATEKTKRETADKSIREDVALTVEGVYGKTATLKSSLEAQIAEAKNEVKTEASDKISAEETSRKDGDATLTVKLNDAVASLNAKDTELATLIGETKTEVTSGYRTADEAIQTQVTTNANTIADNRTLFDNAKTAIEGSVSTLTSKVDAEVSDRKSGDATTLQTAKDYAKSLLSSALRYQGQVATLSDLDAKTATAIKGDMWNVLNDGEGLASNYAFNGTGWDKLTESIDLSAYATETYVDGNVSALEAKDAEIEGKVSANTEKINADIAAEKSRATTAETTLQSSIKSEETARMAKDSSLETSLNSLTAKVSTEATRLENLIKSTADTKELDAITRENAIQSGLQTADANLLAKVNALSETVASNKVTTDNAIAQEETDRKNAVTELKNELTVTSVDGSSRLVGMGEVLSKLGAKQDVLQSGINVKTINGESVLGSGDIEIKAKTAFEIVLDPTTMEFDVSAEEVKAAIDAGDEIVIREDGAVNDVTYRKSLVKNNINTITVYAHSGNDGQSKMVVFTIAKATTGSWQYSGSVKADLDAERVKRSGDTMLGNLAFEYAGDAENKAVLANNGLTLTKTVGAYTTKTEYGAVSVKHTAKDGKEYEQKLPDESGTFVVNEKDPVFAAWKSGSSIAAGYGSKASGNCSSVFGCNNEAKGNKASVFGYHNTARDYNSSAVGYNNTASGDSTSAFGYSNQAKYQYASAFGSFNVADCSDASAFGNSNTASGFYSSAFGYANTAKADSSTAIGYNAYASVEFSIAFSQTPELIYLGSSRTDKGATAKTLQSYLDEKANTSDLTSLEARVKALEEAFATGGGGV